MLEHEVYAHPSHDMPLPHGEVGIDQILKCQPEAFHELAACSMAFGRD